MKHTLTQSDIGNFTRNKMKMSFAMSSHRIQSYEYCVQIGLCRISRCLFDFSEISQMQFIDFIY